MMCVTTLEERPFYEGFRLSSYFNVLVCAFGPCRREGLKPNDGYYSGNCIYASIEAASLEATSIEARM